MVRCNDQSLVRLLGHALRNILLRDFESWTDFEDNVYNLLTQSPTPERIYCALIALHSLAKLRQYYVNEERSQITVTSRRFFPVLLELCNTLEKDFNPTNAMLTKEAIKIFFKTVRLDIDEYIRDFQVNDSWMDLHQNLFVKCIMALRQMQDAKMNDTEYFASPYWSILKWMLRTIKRYTFRYGDPNKEDEKFETFANHWSQKYSCWYWEKLTELLFHRKSVRAPFKVQEVAISIIFNLFDCDIVEEKFGNTYDQVLFESVFDLLRFTKEEEELFNDNPVEYFRKNDEGGSKFGPDGQALCLFGKALKRKQHLKNFMKFVNECLSTGKNPRTGEPVTVIDREAIFRIIETHSIAVSKIKNCATIISGLLANFVEPELRSEHGFMRMRACRMVTSYCSGTLDVDLLKKLSEGVCKCLQDKDLPVRSCAAQALEGLLKKKELQEFFLPDLKSLLQIYVKLINEFENDTLISSLRGIFEMYSENIGPYALDLVKNLVELFFKCLNKEKKAQENDDGGSEADKEVMESGFACQGCIGAIEEILRSNVSQDILQQSYLAVEPIIDYAFTDDGFDFLADVSGVINTIFYNLETIPEGLWSYFSILCYSMIGKPEGVHPNFPEYATPKLRELFNNMSNDAFASECICDLSSILRNLINKGDIFFFNQVDFYQNKLTDLFFKFIIGGLEAHLSNDYDTNEVVDLLTLCGYMIAQNPGTASNFIPKVLTITMDALPKKFQVAVKDAFLYNLGYCMWNNTLTTLEYLSSTGKLMDILNNWSDQHKKCVSYMARKGSFIGLMSLFSLTTEQLQKAQIPIIQYYTLMVSDLPKLAADQERIINQEFMSDGSFDDDMFDFGDDDDIDIDLDEPDMDAPKPNKKAQNKKLSAAIQKTQNNIDKLKENEMMERDEAKEAFGEISNKLFKDKSDRINEILVFETTITSLQTSNPILYKEIEAATTPEMKTILAESIAKVKSLIDSK